MADGYDMPTRKANPAPLGLLGFGMTTVLLSLHNAGITPLDNVVLAMGAFCGGLTAAFWRMGYLDPGLVLAFGLMSLTVALLRRRSGPAALFFS